MGSWLPFVAKSMREFMTTDICKRNERGHMMDKLSMRLYIADLETRIDMALKKWQKIPKDENGETAQCRWHYEQAHITLDIFWHDKKERVRLYCTHPRKSTTNEWDGLTDETANNVIDRIGNFAQIVQGKRHNG
jgi:hypothetical protein